ncbi:MAG: colanic acid biosynthesis glycosyl transferase WcaI [Verrucomicrobiota bacterium]|jgi:glycosyltransferase involved in cell wall biosynthesis
MKVLFLNRVCPPADGATGRLLAELAPALVRRGCEVTIVTSQAGGNAPASETIDGVHFERVNAARLVRASHWRRALGYLTVYPALLLRVLRLPRADVVVTMTDPPLLALLGPIVRAIKGCRLVHWAQDLYPEVAVELGVLRKEGALARLCTCLSSWAVRQHDRTIVVGRCMKEKLTRRGLPADSIRVIPNWTRSVEPLAHSENRFRREHKLEGRWVVMYSGNLGLAHPFQAVVDAAGFLQSGHPDILFLIVGAGPRLAEVRRDVESRALANVRFLPAQSSENLAHSLGAADLHLASMLENLCGLVVPSKVYGILAAGRPCIFLGPRLCEAARVIDEFQCGAIAASDDGMALARCLVEWSKDPQRCRQAGARASQAATQFSLETAAPLFYETLVEAAQTGDGLAVQQTASSTQA